jgi:hypothetical protein
MIVEAINTSLRVPIIQQTMLDVQTMMYSNQIVLLVNIIQQEKTM